MVKKPKLNRCPACNNTKGAEIIYGMPVDELWPFIEKGLMVGYGCVPPLANETYYKYQCTGCGNKFGENAEPIE